jgi:hypothetical protein
MDTDGERRSKKIGGRRMKTSLSCPCCVYETPTIEISEEFPTKEAVMEELDFWLNENHPDFCPNNYNPDDYEDMREEE